MRVRGREQSQCLPPSVSSKWSSGPDGPVRVCDQKSQTLALTSIFLVSEQI